MYSTNHPVNISVVGCGGTGSMILRDLARMHVTLQAMGHPGLHVSAFDPDVFSEANIGRQLMDHSDVGRSKAIVLIERINRVYGVQWNGYKNKFRFKHQGNPTLLITAVDTIDARRKIYNSSLRFISKIENVGGYLYWIDAGNGHNFGQVMLGTSKTLRQPKSLNFKGVGLLPSPIEIYQGVKEEGSEDSCSVAQALGKQDLMINSMMAQIVSQMIWSMIREKRISYRGVYLNLQNFTMRPVKI